MSSTTSTTTRVLCHHYKGLMRQIHKNPAWTGAKIYVHTAAPAAGTGVIPRHSDQNLSATWDLKKKTFWSAEKPCDIPSDGVSNIVTSMDSWIQVRLVWEAYVGRSEQTKWLGRYPCPSVPARLDAKRVGEVLFRVTRHRIKMLNLCSKTIENNQFFLFLRVFVGEGESCEVVICLWFLLRSTTPVDLWPHHGSLFSGTGRAGVDASKCEACGMEPWIDYSVRDSHLGEA